MRKIRSFGFGLCVAVVLLLGGLCSKAFAAEPEWYPGRLLVKAKPGVSMVQVEEFNKTMGVKAARILKAGENDWQIIDFDPLVDIKVKAKEYLKSGLVLYVEPDYVRRIVKMPNDPSFLDEDKCYSFKNTSTTIAWDMITDAIKTNIVVRGSTIVTNITDIIVAVVDSGLNYNHEDLAGNMWTNPNEIPDNGIDDDGNGVVDDYYGVRTSGVRTIGDPMDMNGHGTHVSGTIGACGNNELGTAGVSWKVKILGAAVLGADGTGYDSRIIEGLAYARSMGANVINMSLGGPGFSRTFLDEIKACAKAGIIIVCAAGNDASNNDSVPTYPANYGSSTDNIIVVGSCTSKDRISSFSNYGKKTVDVFAPGSDIWSTGLKFEPDGVTTVNDYYEMMSGTSMACPFVAGSVALCMAAHPNDTYLQIKSRIMIGVDPISAMKRKCVSGGRINVANIVKNVEQDGFYYTVTSDTTATITGYHGGDTDVVIPSLISDKYNVNVIAVQAFASNKSLKSVVVPDSVTTIEVAAFQACSGLTSVTLGTNLFTIGASAFSSCTSLPEITIPASVTTLGSGWILGCTAMKSINVAEENESFASENGFLLSKDGSVLLCSPSGKDTAPEIPASVTTIGESAFAYSTLLPESITLPANVRRIDQNAFCYCTSLKEVKFGSAFTSVGIYAFYGCTSLNALRFDGNAPAAMDESFSEMAGDTTVYYRSNTVGWELDDQDLWHGLLAYEEEIEPEIIYNIVGGKLIITFVGTLYSSEDNVNWSVVKGAVSPYTPDPVEKMLFYRAGIE